MKQLFLFIIFFITFSCNSDKRYKGPDLTHLGIANDYRNVLGGLQVGDRAPNFIANDNRGRTIELEKELDRYPIILTFYRGHWCPYCNSQLADFQDQLKSLSNYDNARIIAVTPQHMSYIREYTRSNKIYYSLISDEHHEIMEKYKVKFHVTDDYNSKVKEAKGASLYQFNADEQPVLPIPATYIIGQDMIIKYKYYEEDYKQRVSLDSLLRVLG